MQRFMFIWFGGGALRCSYVGQVSFPRSSSSTGGGSGAGLGVGCLTISTVFQFYSGMTGSLTCLRS